MFNNPNTKKLLEEKLIYFSPLLAALCFLSTENRSSKIKSLQVILLHLILDSLILITSTLLIFFIPILFSLRFSFSLIYTLINKAPIYLSNNPFLLIFPLLTCLILLFSNFLIGKVIKDLRELFSSISLNLVSFVLYIVFLISLSVSILPSIIYLVLVFTDVFKENFMENFMDYSLLIVETFFLFLLVVGGIVLAVKTIFLFFAVNSKFYSFFDILKNNAEKLLTIIENIDNNTTMKNLFASLLYSLVLFSPSLIFLLTTKDDFMKFHSIQAIFLRQYSFSSQYFHLIIGLSIAIPIATVPCCIMHVPNVGYWLSKGIIKISDYQVFMAFFLTFTPSIPLLAIILYLYYSVFSLYRETQEGKCTESPTVKTYIHEFLTKPIENIGEKSSKKFSFNEALMSFLILLTKNTNSSLKNRILRRILLWSIENYVETIFKNLLSLWIIALIIAFCGPLSLPSFLYLPLEKISLLCCTFSFLLIFIIIALPKILPAPKLITSLIDQLSKEDNLQGEGEDDGNK